MKATNPLAPHDNMTISINIIPDMLLLNLVLMHMLLSILIMSIDTTITSSILLCPISIIYTLKIPTVSLIIPNMGSMMHVMQSCPEGLIPPGLQ